MSISEEIKRVKSENRHELTLSGRSVSQEQIFPDIFSQLFTCIQLNMLEISYFSNLEELPFEIAQLKKLTRLTLHNLPSFISLGEGLAHLKALRCLRISNNIKLSQLPADLFNGLTDLNILNLQANCLHELPKMDRLNLLQSANFSQNQLELLPDLSLCTNLAILDISSNRLKSLPGWLPSLLSLKELRATDNLLESVPRCLIECPKLKELHLSGNNSTLNDARLKRLVEDNRSPIGNVTSAVLQHLRKSSPSATSPTPTLTADKQTVESGRENASQSSSSSTGNSSHSCSARSKVKICLPNSDCQVSFHGEGSPQRRFFFACILRGVHFDEDGDLLRQFLQYQDHLHKTVADDRKSASLGSHDSDLVKFPLVFTSKPVNDVEIQMLNYDQVESAFDLINRLNKRADEMRRNGGSASGVFHYARLLRGVESVTCLLDGQQRAISLHPITNCDSTKIGNQTKNVLLEVSGAKHDVCKRILDKLLTWCAQNLAVVDVGSENGGETGGRCLRVEQIKVMDRSVINKLRSVYPSRADFKGCQDLEIIFDY